MSASLSDYPLNHRVFSGGRYLRAFDHCPDIDHFEHSILTYLGSLMPFDKGFIDLPAFPSVATMARSTKISETTVRKKIKALQQKGYIKVKAVRLINSRGHFQQSSNDYLISKRAFSFFDEVLGTDLHIQQLRKRAVGDSLSYVPEQPSPAPLAEGSCTSSRDPLFATKPNSQPKLLKEHPDRPDSFCEPKDIFTKKSEVDRIALAWMDVVKKPVSKSEKEKFLREYIRCDGNEIHFMERLLKVAADPYLLARAKSINFLFAGLEAALKNKKDIEITASKALQRVESRSQLDDVLSELPTYIGTKSQNYIDLSQKLVQQLLQRPLDQVCDRIGVAEPIVLPCNERELKAAIERRLADRPSQRTQERLQTILLALTRSSFEACLKLFVKYAREP